MPEAVTEKRRVSSALHLVVGTGKVDDQPVGGFLDREANGENWASRPLASSRDASPSQRSSNRPRVPQVVQRHISRSEYSMTCAMVATSSALP